MKYLDKNSYYLDEYEMLYHLKNYIQNKKNPMHKYIDDHYLHVSDLSSN